MELAWCAPDFLMHSWVPSKPSNMGRHGHQEQKRETRGDLSHPISCLREAQPQGSLGMETCLLEEQFGKPTSLTAPPLSYLTHHEPQATCQSSFLGGGSGKSRVYWKRQKNKNKKEGIKQTEPTPRHLEWDETTFQTFKKWFSRSEANENNTI